LDPEAYCKIDIKNSRRLIRALEVTILSGKPYSAQLNQKRTPSHGWHVVMVGIEHDRTALYQRIDERTRQMIADGLKEEVISVIEHRQRQALQTVGYTEMFQHLDGALTLEETEKLIAQHTRNYAKRQMTWFNRYENLIWIAPTDSNQMADAVMKHLHQ
jgi:tRNA dimethylallyltransferase